MKDWKMESMKNFGVAAIRTDVNGLVNQSCTLFSQVQVQIITGRGLLLGKGYGGVHRGVDKVLVQHIYQLCDSRQDMTKLWGAKKQL